MVEEHKPPGYKGATFREMGPPPFSFVVNKRYFYTHSGQLPIVSNDEVLPSVDNEVESDGDLTGKEAGEELEHMALR
jgi:hypothetical protein